LVQNNSGFAGARQLVAGGEPIAEPGRREFQNGEDVAKATNKGDRAACESSRRRARRGPAARHARASAQHVALADHLQIVMTVS
jgi:hypothetical protein